MSNDEKSREPRANKKSKPSAINRAIRRGVSKTSAIVRGIKFKQKVKDSKKTN